MRRYKLASFKDLLIARAAVHHGSTVRVIKVVIDTGASKTVLSWSILEGLGYDPGGVKERVRLITASGFEMAPQVIVDQLHCLGQEGQDLAVVCHDLPFDHYVDGLLGMDFLRAFDFSIHPKQEFIEVHS